MSMNLGTAIAYIDIDANKFTRGMTEIQSGLRTFNDKTLDTSTRFKALGSTMQSTGRKMTLGVTLPLAGMAGAAAKSAIDFESAFAGVRKTVDASESDMRKLESGIRDMAKEMPTAATEIAGVAEAAGQLGIKTPSILGFTKTMVMLGDSTNMSAEEAATSLARLANITGMSQNDFDRLGSTIVALGNNMATTESEITAMGLRLAGAGSQVGMTEPQIMSFAAALSSVGIEAEAGGSAFSKVMVDMQLATEKGGKKLNQFAKVAGMSASDFKKAFETDASGAIMKFIEGLGSAEERGESAIGILDGMGISEVRMRDALLRAAGASDVFSEALGIGTQAWEENTALTNEANQRYETTASKLLILKNNLIEVGIQIGGILIPYIQDFVSWLQGLIEKFQGLEPSTQDFIVKAGLMAAVIGPLLMIFGSLISAVTTIGGALSGLAGIFGITSGAAATAGGAIATTGGAAATTGGALGALGGAAGILGGILSGGLIFALFGLIAKLGESREALGWLQDKFGSLGTVIGGVCEFIAGIWNITIDNMINVGKLGFDVLAAMIDGPGGATVKDAFAKYSKGVEETNKKAWDNITMKTTRELSQQKNSVDKETKEASDKAKTNTDKMAKDMTDNAKKGADGVGKEMKNTSKVVMDESGKIPKDVQSNMSKSVQSMKQAGSDIYNGMNTSFAKTASQGKKHFSDLFNGVTRSTSKMASEVISDWNRIKSSLSGTITGNVQIKVHGVQAALNQINSVKNAAKTRSVSPSPIMNLMAMPQSFAMPIDTNMYAQAYDMVRSNDIASYVSSQIPNSINLNIDSDNGRKSKRNTDRDLHVEVKIEKVENKTSDSPKEIAEQVVDQVIYKIKRERYALGGA
ncbi:phage tail tape measure protein [Paraclostridium bifermentans]|uniref:phage tail tape measure protein n=1 Tax=Paraclostridium bifermentans TaxID=1490 RepID=UPI001F1FC9E1|nr:phage tail tape measure protein [Paraclostridium bifermentans]MCE9677208.1 phage tail tape measure protein [Paraclostridium bifermentans]